MVSVVEQKTMVCHVLANSTRTRSSLSCPMPAIISVATTLDSSRKCLQTEDAPHNSPEDRKPPYVRHWNPGAPEQGLLTSFGVNSRNSLNEKWCIGLRILHEDQQKLQGRLHHQTELEKRQNITQKHRQPHPPECIIPHRP